MIRITVIKNRFDEVTIELPLVEQSILEAVLDAVARFVRELTVETKTDEG